MAAQNLAAVDVGAAHAAFGVCSVKLVDAHSLAIDVAAGHEVSKRHCYFRAADPSFSVTSTVLIELGASTPRRLLLMCQFQRELATARQDLDIAW